MEKERFKLKGRDSKQRIRCITCCREGFRADLVPADERDDGTVDMVCPRCGSGPYNEIKQNFIRVGDLYE